MDNKITTEQKSTPGIWRSLDEYHGDEKVLDQKGHEFLPGVTDDFDPEKHLTGISRRKFLALAGSVAAVAAAGCTNYKDKGAIVPYTKKPEDMVVGVANYYASTCTGCSLNCGVLIKTREGRPIKVDGNPDHPVSKGKICSKGQGLVLNLYDPSRLKNPRVKKGGAFADETWANTDKLVLEALKGANGKEIAIVSHTNNSPAFQSLLNDFTAKYPSVKSYSYELFSDEAKNNAWKKSYGSGSFPVIKWNEAKVVLSLEGDFLGTDGNRVEQMRLYAQTRDVNNIKNFSRVYSAEANVSITGINADYRLRVLPHQQFALVGALLKALGEKGVSVPAFGQAKSLKDVAGELKLSVKTLENLVKDLYENRGKSIVFAGKMLDEATHILVNLLNDVLGNTALYEKESVNNASLTASSEVAAFVQRLKNKQVHTVIHINCDPVAHFPSDWNYKDALKNAAAVVTFSEIDNDTVAASTLSLPVNHNFESWGDAKTRTGVHSLMQPVIAPLYSTRQPEAALLHWLNEDKEFNQDTYHQYLKNYWQKSVFAGSGSTLSYEKFWLTALHDGLYVSGEKANASYSFNSSALSGLSAPAAKGVTLGLYESMNLGDGRFANNGWLQELPHPVSKVTWDNYAAISYAFSKEINVKTGDEVEVSAGGKTVALPVLVQPGLADNFVAVELGYGAENVPIVAKEVGVNANVFLKAPGSFFVSGAEVKATGKKLKLFSTQDHHSFDDPLIKDIHLKREIIREGTVAEFVKNPKFLHEEKAEKEHINLYTEVEYKDVKWGMAIDLNKCTGCGECVVACNVENNIPVVGKESVGRGREMMWLRIDRYYAGEPDEPKVSVQPMLCQHCDQAPCENVCPVVATTHSPDGLNQMIYNRCVGTRYCSNNCPFKVRRFNFFDFRDKFRDGYYYSQSVELVHNPEVTVRSRGVMEKCSFCVQRISEARANAVAENRPLKGSDVQTACQVACGTDAIKFGDINNKNEEFYTYRNHELGYYLLEELNIRPNVTYLAKLRNTLSEEA